MRPISKGDAPQEKYKEYQDAADDLIKAIGPYCSYCEMNISHVPEVEHRISKSRGGEKYKWENFLLACKYCNTRKGKKIGKDDIDNYLWPDKDDTFHAFKYDRDVPRLNISYLNSKGETERKKAENLFHVLKLDNIPITPGDKDRRYNLRNETRNCAQQSKNGLNKMKTDSERNEYLDAIKNIALAKGFFSVWMEVFKDDEEVKKLLISSFKGTRAEYCSEWDEKNT